jgi:hypothetical protein
VGPKGQPPGIDRVYHEERLEVGGQIGEDVAYRQGSKEEEVFESRIQSVPDLRQTQGLLEKVRYLPDLLSGHGSSRRDPGRR